MAKTLAKITPVSSYGEFDGVDMVVEAIVENEAIKKKVLAEIETKVAEDAILASNTSTIRSINSPPVSNDQRIFVWHSLF